MFIQSRGTQDLQREVALDQLAHGTAYRDRPGSRERLQSGLSLHVEPFQNG